MRKTSVTLVRSYGRSTNRDATSEKIIAALAERNLTEGKFLIQLDDASKMTRGDLASAARAHHIKFEVGHEAEEITWEELGRRLDGNHLIVIANAATTDEILNAATGYNLNWLPPGACAIFTMIELTHSYRSAGPIEILKPIEFARAS